MKLTISVQFDRTEKGKEAAQKLTAGLAKLSERPIHSLADNTGSIKCECEELADALDTFGVAADGIEVE